ncbi:MULTISPECIES: OsmC family protein [unclassified Fusibacter]|uniref:OsmC family protein n=1 Tax=unclassified Fusibacter TaxID=2624464 RepID=UPI0010120D77|nr:MULTISPECIES: OsmC family protein [unclassified Fusibacter]MCK8059329.1 OsmC family protein [Fusibacter sp. A2]NPE21207.1 osmotically inducible protein OsmC [Fusibacter sp. A1]RXV62475.1 osmotically inducible protein OsmC [Fusibacter sp. A1]
MARMVVSFPGNKKVNCSVRDFVVATDQPERAGGDDTAPTPFELFLASIATCAGIYAAGFCEKRGLSTEGMSLELDTEKDEETGLIGNVKLVLHTAADFPEKYHKAIINSMDLCAVKKHMQNPPTFEIEVK